MKDEDTTGQGDSTDPCCTTAINEIDESVEVKICEENPNTHLTVRQKWLNIERAIYNSKLPSERNEYNRQMVLRQLPNEKRRIFPFFCSDQIVETEIFHDFELGDEYTKHKRPPKSKIFIYYNYIVFIKFKIIKIKKNA